MKKLSISILVAATALFTSVAPSMAGGPITNSPGQTTFAKFIQTSPSATPFQFTNAGSSSFMNLTSSPIAVKFRFTAQNGYTTSHSYINALLTFSAVASTPATVSGTTTTEAISAINMTFTAVHPLDFKSNLLTISMSTGQISGTTGANAATLSANSHDISPIHNKIRYSSDFLQFGPATGYHKDFSISLANLSAPFQQGSGGYLQNFVGSGSGSFAASPLPASMAPVPEASTVLSFGSLLLLGGLLLFRRSKSVANLS